MFTKKEKWTKKLYSEFKKYLKSQKEAKKFLDFSQKSISTNYKMIGIKIPVLRKIASKIATTDIISFLNVAEDNTYEEVLIQGLVISYIKDVDIMLSYFDKFILKIDNWAICDACISSMKIVKKNKKLFFTRIKQYLKSQEEFVVRVGVVLLLDYYIDDYYIDKIFTLVDSINRDEYYINMAIAWLISECFVNQKEKTYKYLKNNHLNKFTYNKAIQKIIESLRVSKEDKDILRTLKK